MAITIVRVQSDLPTGFDDLRREAQAEGHTHMERLAADWVSGSARFDGTGELLLAAFIASVLAGVGGITIDPNWPAALRMRRFYVRPQFRRRRVARQMADVLLEHARGTTPCVLINTASPVAAQFWQAIGFVPDRRDGHTHVWQPNPKDGVTSGMTSNRT